MLLVLVVVLVAVLVNKCCRRGGGVVHQQQKNEDIEKKDVEMETPSKDKIVSKKIEHEFNNTMIVFNDNKQVQKKSGNDGKNISNVLDVLIKSDFAIEHNLTKNAILEKLLGSFSKKKHSLKLLPAEEHFNTLVEAITELTLSNQKFKENTKGNEDTSVKKTVAETLSQAIESCNEQKKQNQK